MLCEHGVRNADAQTVQVFVLKPFLQMTRDEAHFVRIVCVPFHLRTAQAHFNGTTPQRHGENRLMFHPHERLRNRLRHIEFNPHPCFTPR